MNGRKSALQEQVYANHAYQHGDHGRNADSKSAIAEEPHRPHHEKVAQRGVGIGALGYGVPDSVDAVGLGYVIRYEFVCPEQLYEC